MVDSSSMKEEQKPSSIILQIAKDKNLQLKELIHFDRILSLFYCQKEKRLYPL